MDVTAQYQESSGDVSTQTRDWDHKFNKWLRDGMPQDKMPGPHPDP